MMKVKVLKDINFGGNTFKEGSVLVINKDLAEKYIREGLVEELKEKDNKVKSKPKSKSNVRKKKGLFKRKKR